MISIKNQGWSCWFLLQAGILLLDGVILPLTGGCYRQPDYINRPVVMEPPASARQYPPGTNKNYNQRQNAYAGNYRANGYNQAGRTNGSPNQPITRQGQTASRWPSKNRLPQSAMAPGPASAQADQHTMIYYPQHPQADAEGYVPLSLIEKEKYNNQNNNNNAGNAGNAGNTLPAGGGKINNPSPTARPIPANPGNANTAAAAPWNQAQQASQANYPPNPSLQAQPNYPVNYPRMNYARNFSQPPRVTAVTVSPATGRQAVIPPSNPNQQPGFGPPNKAYTPSARSAAASALTANAAPAAANPGLAGTSKPVVNTFPGIQSNSGFRNTAALESGQIYNPASASQLTQPAVKPYTPAGSTGALDINQTISSLKKYLARHPDNTKVQVACRLLLAAVEKNDEQALGNLANLPADSQHESVDITRALLLAEKAKTTKTTINSDQANVAIHALNNMKYRIAEKSDLVVSNVRICKKVFGFGQYEELPREQLKSGKSQLINVYFEVRNFTSQLTDKGKYKTLLHVDINLYNDKYRSLARISDDVEDISDNRRNDFYLTGRDLSIPALPPGKYEIVVTLEDKLANKIALPSRVRFEVGTQSGSKTVPTGSIGK